MIALSIGSSNLKIPSDRAIGQSCLNNFSLSLLFYFISNRYLKTQTLSKNYGYANLIKLIYCIYMSIMKKVSNKLVKSVTTFI